MEFQLSNGFFACDRKVGGPPPARIIESIAVLSFAGFEIDTVFRYNCYLARPPAKIIESIAVLNSGRTASFSGFKIDTVFK